jgi:ribosomal protein S27E
VNGASAKLAERGYRVVYRSDRVNHCPGCGRSQWHVGRSTAECAFCGTAIPLAAGSSAA